jgi:hypothetical protein
MTDIIAQAIGIVATVVQIGSYQVKSNRGLFIAQGIAGFLFSVNFFLLGAYTAAILNLANILRSVLMTLGERHRKIIIPISMCIVYTVAVAFTYDGWFSLLLLLVQIGGTLSMWTSDGAVIRIYQLFICSPVWLANNIIALSIGGIITETFSIVSIIISVIRYGFGGLRSNRAASSSSQKGKIDL